jgi:hypothetical protein
MRMLGAVNVKHNLWNALASRLLNRSPSPIPFSSMNLDTACANGS